MTRRTALLGVIGALSCTAGLASVATADPGGSHGQPFTDNLIHLQAMPRASAQFIRGFGGSVSVKLSVTGVTPGSAHSVDVERGTCTAPFRPGADLAKPATVQADATGQIHQEISLGRLAHAYGPLALTLRQGLTGSTPNGVNPLATQALACTQVPHVAGFGGAWSHVISRARTRLLPVSESGAPLSGTATYTYNADDPKSQTGQSVTVKINAFGFVPGTVHAAHIHSGTCTSQGAVVVMLPDLTADRQGHIFVNDTVPVTQQPEGPLYINIHEGNSNQILDANGNPTLAFRPLLCGDVSQSPSQTASTPEPTTTAPTTTTPTSMPTGGGSY